MVLPSGIFDSILMNDLYDSTVSFTVYILNPKLSKRVRYSYAPSNTSTCYSSMLFSYTDSLQYMLVDFSAVSSQYGRFIVHQGFEMIQYPKLLIPSNDKWFLNPTFIPELASLINESVSLLLYPEIHQNIFAMEFQNTTRILENGPLWDFGRVHVFIITIIEEIKDNDFNSYMANYANNRQGFWESHLKQIQSTLPSQKQIELHTIFLPLSKTPIISMLLTESLELVSTNNTSNRKDMHLVIRCNDFMRHLMKESGVFEEVGIRTILEEGSQGIGTNSILPAFMYT